MRQVKSVKSFRGGYTITREEADEYERREEAARRHAAAQQAIAAASAVAVDQLSPKA